MDTFDLNEAPFAEAAAIIAKMNGSNDQLDLTPVQTCGKIIDAISRNRETLDGLDPGKRERINSAAEKVDPRLIRGNRLSGFLREVVGISRNPGKFQEERRVKVATFYSSLCSAS